MLPLITSALGHDPDLRGYIDESTNPHLVMSSFNELVYGKIVVLVFRRHQRSPVLVAKFPRFASHSDSLALEYENLARVYDAATPTLRRTIPKPVAARELGDRLVVFTEALPGRTVLNRLRMGSWLLRSRHHTRSFLRRTLSWVIEFEDTIRLVDGIGGHVARDSISDLVKSFRGSEAAEAGLRASADAWTSLSHRVPQVPIHGDLTIRNMLVHRRGIGILDWEYFRSKGLPVLNLFSVTTSLGLDFPRLWPNGMSPADRFLAVYSGRSWLSRMIIRTVDAYARHRGLTRQDLYHLFVAALAFASSKQASLYRQSYSMDAYYLDILETFVCRGHETFLHV